jgi:hypothetical protein
LIDDAQVWNNYKIGIALPIGNGTDTAWAGGTTGTYTDCDEYPHDTDTTYIETATSGNAETYDMTAFTGIGGASGDTIHGVVVTNIRRRTGATTTNLRTRLRSGATTNETSSAGINTTYVQGAKLYLTNPDTSTAWTQTTFDAAEAGGSLQSAQTARITQVCLNCLFTTPAASTAAGPILGGKAFGLGRILGGSAFV